MEPHARIGGKANACREVVEQSNIPWRTLAASLLSDERVRVDGNLQRQESQDRECSEYTGYFLDRGGYSSSADGNR